MLIKKEFLNKLKDFGLNSYEAKLWTALLSRGVATAGELSDIANVPRSRSYDVLESLEKKGFIMMKLGKPIKYIVVSPLEVIERVKKKIETDVTEQLETLDNVKSSEVIKELNLLHKQGVDLVDPTDISGSIKGRSNVYDNIDGMIKSSEKSVFIMTTEEGLVRKAENLKKSLQKAVQRGVSVKILCPPHKNAENIAKELKDIVEIRTSKDVKGRMVVIDGKQATFIVTDDAEVHPMYDVGIWTSTSYLASTMQQMLDKIWEQAEEVSVLKVKN